MNLTEKTEFIQSDMITTDKVLQSKIKKNLYKDYKNLPCKLKILIEQKKQHYRNHEIFFTNDMIWFFLQICAMNNFKEGKYLFGEAMKNLSKKEGTGETAEKKFERIVDLKSLDSVYSKVLVLRLVHYLYMAEYPVKLDSFYLDLIYFDNKNKITQKKWVEQFVM